MSKDYLCEITGTFKVFIPVVNSNEIQEEAKTGIIKSFKQHLELHGIVIEISSSVIKESILPVIPKLDYDH